MGRGAPVRTDLAQARATLEAAAGRTADLLDSIPGGDLPVKGSEWTVFAAGCPRWNRFGGQAVDCHLGPQPVRT